MTKDNSDDFIKDLKKKIMDKEFEIYNEKIIALFHDPMNWGNLPIEEISASHSYRGPCGDSITFLLNIEGDKIKKARFIADGCASAVATASETTILIEGKTLDFAEKLKPEDIDLALNGLPEDHKHCAELAIKALKGAIEKYKKSL